MDINRRAPVIARAEAIVNAPRGVVWSVQGDVKRWPEWNPAVSRADCDGPLSAGVTFRWKTSGLRI